ncbi:MAG: hypothetical protein QOG51_40 [Verrucomicrobiota bacterium]
MNLRSATLTICVALVCLLPASVVAASLRYDGIYRHHDPAQDYSVYLRFYSDGTALCVTSTGTPEEIVPWFNRGSKAGSSGHFTVRRNRLRFTTFGFEWRIDCTGDINDASLVLRCKDSDRVSRFEFLPMPLPQ